MTGHPTRGMELRDLSVFAGRRQLLQVDSLSLPSTGLVGLIGPNGAGKSTLLRSIAGVQPHGGEKRLDGSWPDQARIGFMPQNVLVHAALSVAECVLLGRREALGWRISAGDWAIVEGALNRLGIGHLAERRMNSLSGGQQQLVLLAQRLSRNPRLLLLDEPTSALDLHHQIEALTHLRAMADGEVLVIAALHDLTLAARFADRLIMLENGRLRGVGNPVTVLRRHSLDQVYKIKSEHLEDRDGKTVVVPHRQDRQQMRADFQPAGDDAR